MITRLPVLVTAAAAAAALSLSACGSDTVSKSKIEQLINDQLGQHQKQTRGYPLTSVSCPKDLDAKVGACEICTASYEGGHEAEVTAKITSVKDGKANIEAVVTKAIK